MDEDQLNQPTSAEPESTTQAAILVNLEGLIKSHIASIDKLNEDAKKHKEMLDDVFENDETFRLHSEQAKEAARIKSATRAQIMKQPSVYEMAEKVKSMKSEIKELKAALSDYLQEYRRMSGLTEIEGEDGEPREIVFTAKLIKRNSKFRP